MTTPKHPTPPQSVVARDARRQALLEAEAQRDLAHAVAQSKIVDAFLTRLFDRSATRVTGRHHDDT